LILFFNCLKFTKIWKDATAIVAIVILNTVIGLFQEYGAANLPIGKVNLIKVEKFLPV
jgi:hypothetical protein